MLPLTSFSTVLLFLMKVNRNSISKRERIETSYSPTGVSN
jgi:hypothetical protein